MTTSRPLQAFDIITSSGRYPDRAKSAVASTYEEAAKTAQKINRLCDLIGYTGPRTISSGFRSPTVNAGIPHAAKKSYHMQGMAADIVGQELGLAIRAAGKKGSDALRTCGLFMEALEATPSWTHIDRGTRTDRPNREFKP